MSIDILEKIVQSSKKRILKSKDKFPAKELEARAREITEKEKREEKFRFSGAIEKKDEISLILELKKASPSKGIISEEFDYLSILTDYKNGASAVSVLTEPDYFLGSNKIFEDVRCATDLPLLRKDFIIDSYQLYESKVMGADAILIIMSILDDHSAKSFIKMAKELGMDALIETHDKTEIERALNLGGKIIGINNRNLRDFSVSFDNLAPLAASVPKECLLVAESGIKTPDDMKLLRETGVAAALIGESVMKAKDRISYINELIKSGKK